MPQSLQWIITVSYTHLVLEMVVAGFSMALMSAIYNIGSVILQEMCIRDRNVPLQ